MLSDLLFALNSAGVDLYLIDGRFYAGPSSALKEELRDKIRGCRRELVAWLSTQAAEMKVEETRHQVEVKPTVPVRDGYELVATWDFRRVITDGGAEWTVGVRLDRTGEVKAWSLKRAAKPGPGQKSIGPAVNQREDSTRESGGSSRGDPER